jgi:hypothetical protein
VDQYETFFRENDDFTFNDSVNAGEIIECIKQMENTNSLGYGGLSANMIKYAANNALVRHLVTLYNEMLAWKYIPENFNASIIVPLIKK